jgi:hypothetical protein
MFFLSREHLIKASIHPSKNQLNFQIQFLIHPTLEINLQVLNLFSFLAFHGS